MEETFYLEKKFITDMIAHAQRENPNECCGILAGKDAEVLKVYPTNNEEKSQIKYRIPAQELFQAIKDIEASGLDLIGIYHSHTHTEAYPSATDVRLAFWPEAAYFIVSLAPPRPTIRAFRIVDKQITEISITVR